MGRTTSIFAAINFFFLPALSNRAACYLRMGKYKLCRVDCSRVIECLPPVPNAAASGKLNPRELRKAQLGTRSRILVRRENCRMCVYKPQLMLIKKNNRQDL